MHGGTRLDDADPSRPRSHVAVLQFVRIRVGKLTTLIQLPFPMLTTEKLKKYVGGARSTG
jgi:hypothetical protein